MLAKPRFALTFAFAAGSFVSLFSLTAAAQDPAAPRPRMRINLPVDVSIVAVGGVAWFTTEFLKGKIAPSSCNWCEPPGVDLAVKNALKWDNTKAADVTSYITGFGLAPLTAFGFDAALVYATGGTVGEWGEDALVILEAITVAADVNQLVKFVVGRERPFVHDLAPDAKSKTSSPGDNNLSFYSGHTMLGFASAVSAGTVATLKGYKAAPWVWGTGLTLAAATGYLRIAADKHYFIDVMTGAVLGSAFGFLIPWLHRPAKSGEATGSRVSGFSSSPLAGGGAYVGVQGIWD